MARAPAQQQIAGHHKQADEAKAKAEAIAAHDADRKKIPELEARIAALVEERSDLTHAWEADVQAKTEALAARDAEARATTEALKARDAALAQIQQKDAQIAALTKEKTELAAARDVESKAKATAVAERDAAVKAKDDTITKLTQERDQARKQHADQAARMQQLEAENAEAHHRHQLMQEEMIKAEAQIELIKDLLLREQGL